MRRLVGRAFYWWLDYVYAGFYQLFSLLDREAPVRYRHQNGRTVLLIPGVYENWHFMKPIAASIYAAGYDVHVLDGLGYNKGTIESMAAVVDEYISANRLDDVVLVAHSKGGLVGKYLLSSLNKSSAIKGLVAVNAPFSGSRYAYVLPFRSLRVFIPTSPIILALAKDRIANSLITSIYSKFDPHIPGGSKLEGADNIELETRGHFTILSSPLAHQAIIKSLDRYFK